MRVGMSPVRRQCVHCHASLSLSSGGNFRIRKNKNLACFQNQFKTSTALSETFTHANRLAGQSISIAQFACGHFLLFKRVLPSWFKGTLLPSRDSHKEDRQGRNWWFRALKKKKIDLTLLHVLTQTWNTSSTLAFVFTVLHLNLILSSPAFVPGSPSCGAPPGTSVLPPKASGSSLFLWKIQARSN